MPIKVCGMSIYSIFLISHSLLLSAILFIHYQLLPLAVNARYIVSHKIKGQTPYSRSYYVSQNELLWNNLRILLYFLTIAGIWKYVSYMDIPNDAKDRNESLKKGFIFLFLGMLLIFVSSYVLSYLDPVYLESETQRQDIEQGIEGTDMRASLQIHDTLHAQDQIIAQNVEKITKLKKEILEKDASYSY
ncbi:hypothetical protein MOSE0_A05028 [Monosporozyma servazzii]